MATRRFDQAESVSSHVQAAIDWFGPSDLLTMPYNVVSEERSYEQVSNSNGAKLLRAPVMDVPELGKDASALHQVSADDPPMLIMHGDKDPGVPISQSLRLAAKLTEQGVEARMVTVKGAGHGGKQFQEAEARDAVRQFLAEHLQR